MRKVAKISTIVYCIFGLIIGIGMVIISLFDNSIPFYVGNHKIYGIWSGVIAIITMPIIMGSVGLAHGIFFWFPIVYIYKKLANK